MQPAAGLGVYNVWQTPQDNKLASAYRQAATRTLCPEIFPYYDSNGDHLNGIRDGADFSLLQRIYPNDAGAQAITSGINVMNGLEWPLVFQ
ncbi:hypothetical protein ACO0K0_10395 [Undibacterium sp. SXout11W]|uniref:hypothetical protein n=1 Tax=Undibacterium sp. SXout11W TaxID=3413050 RepID=UPI003BF1BB9E